MNITINSRVLCAIVAAGLFLLSYLMTQVGLCVTDFYNSCQSLLVVWRTLVMFVSFGGALIYFVFGTIRVQDM